MKQDNKRIAEVIQDGDWSMVDFGSIKKGDTFRLFEPDGRPVVDLKECTEWVAAEDAKSGNVRVAVDWDGEGLPAVSVGMKLVF